MARYAAAFAAGVLAILAVQHAVYFHLRRIYARGPGGAVIWRVRLICCGRDDGDIFRSTWEEADEFRQSYTSGTGVGDPQRPWEGGHIRAGIVERIG